MPAKSAKTVSRKSSTGFTEEERAAAQERVRELRRGSEDGESQVLEKIAKMKGADRDLATRVHKIIKANAPELAPRTWYGMPAYGKNDKVVCFFQDAAKFKARYATLGFSDKSSLDEGNMWPVAYALKELTPTEEAKIAALIRRAVS